MSRLTNASLYTIAMVLYDARMSGALDVGLVINPVFGQGQRVLRVPLSDMRDLPGDWRQGGYVWLTSEFVEGFADQETERERGDSSDAGHQGNTN